MPGSTGSSTTRPLPTASGEENDELITYIRGNATTTSITVSIVSVTAIYILSQKEVYFIPPECLRLFADADCAIDCSSFLYQRLVSLTRRAM